MEFLTNSPEQTEQVGRLLAQQLRGGEVIAFLGGLGAGKTAFTRGLAAGLGITDRVTSPTYTIVNEYLSGRLPLFHFDMYRLSGEDELFDIGWEDYLARGGICAVEWSERVLNGLKDAVFVRIEHVYGHENARKITIDGGNQIADFSL